MMMHWGGFGTGAGGFGLGWIFMVLFWALVVLGIVYLLKQLFSEKPGCSHNGSAEDILKKRYAAGEITKEEYNEKLERISR